MAAVVFAMGLSFLGVWEIPIPGFAGGEKASELAEQEGPSGAFVKGIITTILATPCSGPGMAVALAYCNGKPAGVVYLIFAMLGLGMASPYLLIGAFPKLIRVLPKPGVWMETFKQLMGLVLMGTVIYLLTFTAWANLLPTLTLLLGLAIACWWIGRISITAEFPVKLRGWLVAATITVIFGVFAFFPGKVTLAGYDLYGLRGIMEHRLERYVASHAALQGDVDPILESPEITQHDSEIYWVPYSDKRLERLIARDRTVLVDFTADWCPTCKVLEATVLNTQEVRDVLRQNGVVALVADWTDSDPEITKKLESLGSKQVPVVAIFPAGRPQDHTVLRGFYTKATLLEKLKQAGPSQDVAQRSGGNRVAQVPRHGN
jgi:thiol:disulfide interchange protein